MKFQMLFEGVDRASKVLNKIMAIERKMGKSSQANANAAEKASRAAEAASAGQVRGYSRMQAAAQKAYATAKEGAAAAARATQTLHRRTLALGKAGVGQVSAGVGKAWGGLSVAAGAAVASVGSAMLAAGQLVGVASQFEKFQTVLETTEGSSTKARSSMQWVSTFAEKTPYELEQVMEAFVQLRTRGLDPTNGLLTRLGDTSAAMGVPLMQAVEMMADAVTGENERLKAFGITAEKTGNKIFYNYTDAAGKQQRAAVKANDRLAIQTKLMSIFANKYGGAMEKLSGTWDGMLANMGDLWSGFQLSIMNAGLFDWMKGKAAGALDYINNLKATGQLDVWAKAISDRIVYVLDNAWNFANRVWQIMEKLGTYLKSASDFVGGWERLAAIFAAMAVAPVLISTAAGIVQIAMGLTMLATALAGLSVTAPLLAIGAGIAKVGMAMKALGVALLANPMVLAIAAIAAGAALIYLNWEPIKAFFLDMWASVSNATASAWQTVSGAISSAVGAIPGLVSGAWETLKAVLAWHPAALVYQNWGTISDAVTSAVSGSFAPVQAVWDRLKALFAWSPVEAIRTAWAGISDAIGGLIDGAAARAGAAWEKVKSVFSFGGSDNVTAPAVMTDAVALRENATVALEKLSALDAAAAKIVPAVTGAVGSAKSFLAGISFYDQGAALMETMAAGMRARAMVVVTEIQRMAQMVRDHLPSSPAKVGPLSDIHRLKFGETIAASIRAEPMIKAMRAASAATLATAAISAPVPATAETGDASAMARTQVASVSARASNAVPASAQPAAPPLVYSPTIHLKGATEADKREFARMLREHSREIARIMDEQNRVRDRSST